MDLLKLECLLWAAGPEGKGGDLLRCPEWEETPELEIRRGCLLVICKAAVTPEEDREEKVAEAVAKVKCLHLTLAAA